MADDRDHSLNHGGVITCFFNRGLNFELITVITPIFLLGYSLVLLKNCTLDPIFVDYWEMHVLSYCWVKSSDYFFK